MIDRAAQSDGLCCNVQLKKKKNVWSTRWRDYNESLRRQGVIIWRAAPVGGRITSHLVVYPLVYFGLVIQHYKGLRRLGVAAEDEAEVPALALHIREVYERGVEPDESTGAGRDRQTHTHTEQ